MVFFLRLIFTFAIFLLLPSYMLFGQRGQEFKDLTQRYLLDYEHLHANPELSSFEEKTSKYLYDKLRKLNFIIRKENGHGFVAIMKNGVGPTVMYRTEMDALPIQEKTGLPYASIQLHQNSKNELVPVMHACGHDMHMAIWLGVAEYMTNNKDKWAGTLVFVAQSAEEIGKGAKEILEWGLYDNFEKVDYALALHVSPTLPVGKIGLNSGYVMANVDMIDITVYGKGGHGGKPHSTIDPIYLSSKLVVDFQSIVSRELSPIESGVISVGAIQGGNLGNIIPDSVNLKLTLRSFTPQTRKLLMDGIQRKCHAAAISSDLPPEMFPKIQFLDNHVPALYNDPELIDLISDIFQDSVRNLVVRTEPQMVGDDFAYYGMTPENVPLAMIWLGSISREDYKNYAENNIKLPSLHSSTYHPDAEKTLFFGMRYMSRALIGLMHANGSKNQFSPEEEFILEEEEIKEAE